MSFLKLKMGNLQVEKNGIETFYISFLLNVWMILDNFL